MKDPERAIAINRKASFNYHIEETFEAGMILTGTEVKALRENKANLGDAFGRVTNSGAFLLNLHISPYGKAGAFDQHEPLRTRQLLLHKKEIVRLRGKTQEKGYTIVPLKMYWKNGFAKVLLGLGKGKKQHDKRADMKEKDQKREVSRAMRDHNR